MKKIIHLLNLVAVVALVAVAVGCSTTQRTERLLSSAGFKKVAPANAEQQAHLKTLPTDRLTKVEKNGKTYYVYPDIGANAFLVGQDAQLKNYQRIRDENQAMDQNTFSEAQSNGVLWNCIGSGGDWY
jgi:hypothetical protein